MSLTTKPNMHDNDALVTYRVGPVLCCGPTLPIITITPPPKLTHPPGTQPAEPGIFKHGADIVSATDLRYRFGVKQHNWKQPGQVIITKHNDAARGYFVDEIIDVIHFPETGWGQLPAYLPRGVFSRTLVLNKKIYLYAEFDKLSQLQGSGYLTEYIAQLENQLDKENNTATHNIELNTHTDKHAKPVSVTTLSKEKLSIKNPVEKDPSLKNQTVKNSTQINSPIAANKDQAELKCQSNHPVDANSKAATKANTLKIKSTEQQHLTLPTTSIRNNHTKNLPPVAAKNEITPNKIIPEKINTPLYEKISSNPIKTEPARKEFSKNIHSTKQLPNKISCDKNILKSKNNTETELTKSTTNIETDNANHTLSWIGLFILFILLSTGSYYYLSAPASLDSNVITEALLNPEPMDKNLSINDNISNSYSLTTDITTTSDVDNLSLAKKEKTITKTPALIASPLSHTNRSPPKDKPLDNNEYHANINQDSNTITIELNGPLPPEMIITKPNSTNTDSVIQQPSPEGTRTDLINHNTAGNIITKKIQGNAQQQNSTINKTIEIIHIIVKGDTLWAIAKHYLQNPFLYPELAKLSRIKNPDLIYPGNRVHIIYRPQQQLKQ